MKFSVPQATANAAEIDYLLLSLIAMSLAVLALVFGLMLVYIVRYRRDSPVRRGELEGKSWRFEISWTVATLVIFFGLFIWGADLYVRLFQPPADTLKIYVIGKQWMWKAEHEGGQREINALHVPAGRDVQLLMTSEDVIHDFSVPAFRIKHDVLPGRYEAVWFRAEQTGTYHLFCTQFCGTDHAAMIGEIDVLSPPEFQRWLTDNGGEATLAAEGQVLFMRYGCSGCHGGNGSGGLGGPGGTVPAAIQANGRAPNGSVVRAPSLVGLYGSPVPLSDGTILTADERYLRDSILDPGSQIVASYDNIMPSFAGQVSEEDLVKLIAYIRSLSPQGL